MNMSFLQELFNNITQREASLWRRIGNLDHCDHSQLIAACQALLKSDGEASSISLASRALEIYARLDNDEKRSFFEQLAVLFSAEPEQIDQAYLAYKAARTNENLETLFESCEPRRQELLRRLNLSSCLLYTSPSPRDGLLSRM